MTTPSLDDLIRAVVRDELARATPAPTPAANENADDLLDDRELGAEVGLSRETLQAWRAKGIGPAWLRIGARVIRYRRSDVEAWLAAGGSK